MDLVDLQIQELFTDTKEELQEKTEKLLVTRDKLKITKSNLKDTLINLRYTTQDRDEQKDLLQNM